ncbi:Gfo/Idh/MocA family protein [Aspergillus novofumigatus IBT 16806]|uniref:NAD(P)-binding protein n=1 Tax=Aspergillus novofumigatus (strain IBT 16806) TaxID=1392255 RepID=A0A2I1C3K3_ASPN1|nr:NAD(P)-binding protein [Aspergillus novofumigatus IBT 16806]PKX92206.1 NAD(P)-binding protein [Aspergillus novofumigatus IBT 16806]
MKEPTTEHDLPSRPIPIKGRSLRFLVIGAGSRGNAYARAVTTSTPACIHAVAEPHAFKRADFGRKYIWGEEGQPADGQEFSDWREWLEWETARRAQPDQSQGADGDGVDGVFICTLDETHVEIVTALAPLGLHILCEKPLALSLGDCLAVYKALSPAAGDSSGANGSASGGDNKIFSIGHVLRYSPHNILLRKLLLLDRAIGDIVSLEHTEPVGWWHFAHSYVRGNWRRATAQGDGSLLTKSCHDIDFIMWLLSSPAEYVTAQGKMQTQTHHPRSITSTGTLTQFRRARKPPAAGAAATNCLSCPAERECIYSAVRIYRDLHLSQGETGWPVKIVVPDIEDVLRSSPADKARAAGEAHLLARLREDYSREEMSDEEIARRPWYGRCVFEADNNVCDDQVVTITWDDEDEDESPVVNGEGQQGRRAKTAVFHMIAPTEKQCERRGRVYGTRGEIAYDSRTISIYDFATRSTTTIEVPKQPPEEEEAHGGGDYGLARSFVRAVDAVENEGWDVQRAQTHFVGCTLEEAVRSHAVVFAAEEARREEKVVRWKEWWAEKLTAAGIA